MVAKAIGRFAIELGLVVATPLLLLIVRYFSWGAGPQRLLMLALLFGFVAWTTSRRGYLQSPFEHGRRHQLLALCALLLFALNVHSFVQDIARGGQCLTDMGRPSICAGEWLRAGKNPWSECAPRPRGRIAITDTWSWCLAGGDCIDRKAGGTYKSWTHHGPGFDFMDGYKYGPLLALIYMPVAHALRERGLFVVNFAFWLAQCGLLWALARACFPEQRSAGWRTLTIMLLPLIVPNASLFPKLQIHALGGLFTLRAPEQNTFLLDLTQRCSNDIIPVVLMMAATLLALVGRSRISGVLLGLSLGAKQLPGLFLCALLPRLASLRLRSLFIAMLITTALVYLPFFVWAPREMFANLVLFSIVRPSNSSSLRAYIPFELEFWVSIAQLVIVASVVVYHYRCAERDPPALLRSLALLSIGFVALNKVVHTNYLVWLQPWLALALGGMPFRGEPAAR